jgi:hypothetical protein
MFIKLNANLRSTRAQAIVTYAGPNARLAVYTSEYGILLYTAICGPILGVVVSGVLVFNAVANATAIAEGNAVIGRLLNADGTVMVMEGLSVAVIEANINITNTSIAAGDVVITSSGTITEGNA